MLPRSLRLTRQGFENTRHFKRAHSPHFSISYGTNPNVGGSAIIVPKKAIKSAVGRHFLKRRIRAIIKPLSMKEQVLIVTAKAGTETLSFNEIENELSTLISPILEKRIL